MPNPKISFFRSKLEMEEIFTTKQRSMALAAHELLAREISLVHLDILNGCGLMVSGKLTTILKFDLILIAKEVFGQR